MNLGDGEKSPRSLCSSPCSFLPSPSLHPSPLQLLSYSQWPPQQPCHHLYLVPLILVELSGMVTLLEISLNCIVHRMHDSCSASVWFKSRAAGQTWEAGCRSCTQAGRPQPGGRAAGPRSGEGAQPHPTHPWALSRWHFSLSSLEKYFVLLVVLSCPCFSESPLQVPLCPWGKGSHSL